MYSYMNALYVDFPDTSYLLVLHSVELLPWAWFEVYDAGSISAYGSKVIASNVE